MSTCGIGSRPASRRHQKATRPARRKPSEACWSGACGISLLTRTPLERRASSNSASEPHWPTRGPHALHLRRCAVRAGCPRRDRRNVLEVANNAPSSGRKPLLGLMYDSVARRTWSERAAAGVIGFEARLPHKSHRLALIAPCRLQVDKAAATFDQDLLRLATEEYDRAQRAKQAAPPGRAADARVPLTPERSTQRRKPEAPAREPQPERQHWQKKRQRGARGGDWKRRKGEGEWYRR